MELEQSEDVDSCLGLPKASAAASGSEPGFGQSSISVNIGGPAGT